MTITDLTAQRLDLAGTRAFSAPGAGGPRRETLTTFGRDWLQDIWSQATRGGRAEGVALAAVGSLGRREAGPLSDFDLVLLHYGRSLTTAEVTELADRLWYPIWDAGARLDHCVRTVTQCRSVASADLAAAVGLLDLDWVAGDPEVVAATRATLAHDWRSNARKRLPQLIESIEERHTRHGDLARPLEPDLKEARGGLRDMTVLRALTSAWLADRPHGDTDRAATPTCSTCATRCTWSPAAAATGSASRTTTASPPCSACPTPTTLLTAGGRPPRAPSPTPWTAPYGAPRRRSAARTPAAVGPRRPQLNPLGYGLFEHDGEVVLARFGRPRRPTPCSCCAPPWSPRGTTCRSPRRRSPTWRPGRRRCPRRGPRSRPALFGDLLAAGPGLIPVWEALDLPG